MAKFTFILHSFKLEPVEGVSPLTYKMPEIVAEAPTIQEAWEIAEPQIPEGFRLFCWSEIDPLDGGEQI
jgi:hypothetical protein